MHRPRAEWGDFGPSSDRLPVVFPVPTRPPRRRARPKVIDATGHAVIPLRPLTIGEVLDAAFGIVQRNARTMIGLPVVLAAAFAIGGAVCMALYGLGSRVMNPDLAVALTVILAFGLGGLLLVAWTWLDAVLVRVALQTALGDGFAPSVSKVTLRSASGLFWPMVAFGILASIGVGVISSVTSVLYLAIFPALVQGDETATYVSAVVVQVVINLCFLWGFSYLALAVPAYALETTHAPGWIGKPDNPTGVVGGFGRAFTLIGIRQAARATLITAGALIVCLSAAALIFVGMLLLLTLLMQTLGTPVDDLLVNGWIVAGLVLLACSLTLSAALAFIAACQTVFYLDLRMRREALDLPMRFDCVDVPQPSLSAPVMWLPRQLPPAGGAPGPHGGRP